MDSAASLYRELVKHSEVSSAAVTGVDKGGNAVIETVESQRDLEREEKVKFSKTYFVKADKSQCSVLGQGSPKELHNE